MNRIILHMDMDAFYASVEQLDHPAFRGKPVIVGGPSKRGVVSAASYEARRFGVHSAMPMFQARLKCPGGVFLPVRMERYKALSCRIMETLGLMAPLMEQISIDEAFMDISGLERLLGPPETIGRMIKRQIREATSLTCSVGIAPNKFLAKVASDMKKPDGLVIIRPEEVHEFIAALPIEKVPGVGKKTLEILHDMGMAFLGDVRHLPESAFFEALGQFGERLVLLSSGMDESPVIPWEEAKSISSEDTLSEDTADGEILGKQLLEQSERVGRRLRAKGLKGKTLTLKLKRSDFRQITRRTTLEEATDSTNRIYEEGLRLLKPMTGTFRFRLIGIGVANLTPAENCTRQLGLFVKEDTRDRSWRNMEQAMDAIHAKFGGKAIVRAGLMKKKTRKNGSC